MHSSPWHVLHVVSNHEKRVAQHLSVRSVEHYLPLYTERVKWTDRTAVVERPLFFRIRVCPLRTPEQNPCHLDSRSTSHSRRRREGHGKQPGSREDSHRTGKRSAPAAASSPRSGNASTRARRSLCGNRRRGDRAPSPNQGHSYSCGGPSVLLARSRDGCP